MKSVKVLTVGLLALSLPVFAATVSESALKMIPGGKVVQEKEKEVKVQTKDGSIVEVEFKRNGDFEEASGHAVDKDTFEPGQNLLSLKDAVASVKKAGKTPVGDWSLEDSMMKGWHYEFEGMENGKAMEYLVDAKTGKLRESRQDD
ncbi:PepSY domain-containing protein [Peredibacter sp. HCB2-198]|uniref:PepSY domain-containing protein n=1 Tax=Peredibacter sp. HCB2-198 TaxID=3383025 RepID=UPI0038B513A8